MADRTPFPDFTEIKLEIRQIISQRISTESQKIFRQFYQRILLSQSIKDQLARPFKQPKALLDTRPPSTDFVPRTNSQALQFPFPGHPGPCKQSINGWSLPAIKAKINFTMELP